MGLPASACVGTMLQHIIQDSICHSDFAAAHAGRKCSLVVRKDEHFRRGLAAGVGGAPGATAVLVLLTPLLFAVAGAKGLRAVTGALAAQPQHQRQPLQHVGNLGDARAVGCRQRQSLFV